MGFRYNENVFFFSAVYEPFGQRSMMFQYNAGKEAAGYALRGGYALLSVFAIRAGSFYRAAVKQSDY